MSDLVILLSFILFFLNPIFNTNFLSTLYSGVSGEGSGVIVEGSLVAEPVATPPAADTKASVFLMITVIGFMFSFHIVS